MPLLADSMESCNGLDDDCDGTVDEDVLDGLPCDTGIPGTCAFGVTRCIDGSSICVQSVDAQEEAFDRRDDDCDGATDEGFCTVPGLDLGPYVGAGEDPRAGTGGITEQELTARIRRTAVATEAIRTFACDADLRAAGRIAHDEGLEAWVGAWIGPASAANPAGEAANQAQLSCLCEEAAAGNVDVAIVGSEALLRGDVTEEQLLGYLRQLRACLVAAEVAIPVTTADTYATLLAHPAVIAESDVVFPNYYPFWEGRPIDQAMGYLVRMHQQMVAVAQGKEVVVSETGWPSCGAAVEQAVPSPENAATYFCQFRTWAERLGVRYFYFGAFDESWKASVEGERGACWGLWTSTGTEKQGAFACNTCPLPPALPAVGFAELPDRVDTNLGTFLVADDAPMGAEVRLNGVPVSPLAFDSHGNFALTVPLSVGDNPLELSVVPPDGTAREVTKTVRHDPAFSTAALRLGYVAVVPGEVNAPAITGTVVIDLDRDSVLGILPEQQVVGISPGGGELYMASRDVVETTHHQVTRTLAFSSDIPGNGFLVAPDGLTLYSRNQRLDVPTNTLGRALPTDIVTGSSWSLAPIPGGPVITADGGTIYAGSPVKAIDLVRNTVTTTTMTGVFVSDLALVESDTRLLVSEYGNASGRVRVYDLATGSLLDYFVGIGDFSGEIATVSERWSVVGSAGNPAAASGFLTPISVVGDRLSKGSGVPLPLGDNVASSASRFEVLASASEVFLNAAPGLGVFTLDSEGRLAPLKSFLLGVNNFVASQGRPRNDQIRRIVLKEGG